MRIFLFTLLALLLPPVAIYVKSGTHWQLFLNLFFCVAFYVPAVIHAVWFVRRQDEPFLEPEEFDGLDPYGRD